MIKETDSIYAYKVEHAKDFSFQTMMALARSFVRSLDESQSNELFEKLNRGVDLLSSEPLMNMYLYAFGNMHEAKLKLAFENMGEDYKSMDDFAIIDYGCGQGLASIVLYDHLKSLGLDEKVHKVVLIEPSEAALKRAALHVSTAFPDAEIVTVNKFLDDVTVNDVSCDNQMVFHLFSNILDVESVSIDHLAKIVNEEKSPNKTIICVSPNFGRLAKNKRIDEFCEKLDANEQYRDERLKGEWIKEWSCKVAVYRHSDNSDDDFDDYDLIEGIWCGHDVTIDERFGYITCDGEPEWLIDIKEELKHAFIDDFGVKYSEDKTILYDCNCRGLKEYHVLEGTVEIRTKAFFTANIDKLILPKSVKTIGYRGVYSYGIKNIEVSKENPYFTSSFGALYSKDLAKLVALPMGANRPHYCFPWETKSVEKGVFCTHDDFEPLLSNKS